jgi:hypothetical protein
MLIVFILLNANNTFGQHNEKVNKKKQKEWIEKNIVKLQKNNELKLVKPLEPSINSAPEFTAISYRLNGDSRIQCSGGEWIFFRLHSMHENSEVGDVCLAITNKGKVFVNYEHICGGMVHFIDKTTKIPQDANDFFARFSSDTDNLPFTRWKLD